MAKIVWDKVGERFYETGVSKGVLYPMTTAQESGVKTYGNGVAWNGLTAVTESPSGAEATPLYADNIKYLNLMSAEEFGATIEAYTYPDEFGVCNGEGSIGDGVSIGQQSRVPFGLCYQTKIGSDADSEEGYKIHIIYQALASPSEKAYATINDNPEAITFSWEISTTPVEVDASHKPTASLVIDSTKVAPEKLTQIEKALYGDTEAEPKILMPSEIMAILAPGA